MWESCRGSSTNTSEATRAATQEGASSAWQIPVLIIAYARPKYLAKTLESVLRHRKRPEEFPIFASQDGDHQEVTRMLQERLLSGEIALHLRFRAPADSGAQRLKAHERGYRRLAAHYHWALDQMFKVHANEQLVILEDDLEVAPDFYDYFSATLPLLRSDPCLFCVSAWNDNGKPEVASDTRAILRTDFFPGLGWMLLRAFWYEIRASWPPAYWDEYVRRGDVRRGRHCLRPEVSRTHTFGEVGVSQGQFYKAHLMPMALNQDPVDWNVMDLSFVSTAASFEDFLARQVRGAKIETLETLGRATGDAAQGIVVRYRDVEWKRHAKFFGLTEDMKEGVCRGSYRGVLAFSWRGHRMFLVRDWPLA